MKGNFKEKIILLSTVWYECVFSNVTLISDGQVSS